MFIATNYYLFAALPNVNFVKQHLVRTLQNLACPWWRWWTTRLFLTMTWDTCNQRVSGSLWEINLLRASWGLDYGSFYQVIMSHNNDNRLTFKYTPHFEPDACIMYQLLSRNNVRRPLYMGESTSYEVGWRPWRANLRWISSPSTGKVTGPV